MCGGDHVVTEFGKLASRLKAAALFQHRLAAILDRAMLG